MNLKKDVKESKPMKRGADFTLIELLVVSACFRCNMPLQMMRDER